MYSAIAANKRKTFYLMGFFVVLVGGLGWLAGKYFGNPSITVVALVVSLIYALIQYFIASKIALAMNGAHEIEKRDNPRLYRTVENLAIADGIPMPKVYVIDDPAPNAFATGRDPNNAVVAATSGLLEMMNDQELEGVIAHELSHVKNYDIRVMMIVVGLVGAIGFIADMILRMMWFGGRDDERDASPVIIIAAIAAAILAPLIAMMVQLAVSRRREYLADSSGALLTRYPEGLASALEKIAHSGSTLRRQNTATAHLFLANPLKGGSVGKFFSTHPPIEERIAKLRGMEGKM
ncbi:MAG TPA: zinc metalloprotease HtpX [Candidatus Saccharimonadales bacterium]|nr:zinc metalloprotease HtpX [Candidatus Saccharimonadales bacterium]